MRSSKPSTGSPALSLGVSGSSVALISNPQRGVSTTPLATPKVLSQRPARPAKTNSRTSTVVKANKVSIPAPVPRLQTVLEVALAELAADFDPARSGQAMVRFNHYRKTFQVKNGVLQFCDIDSEYSFSFVYRGNFKRFLRLDGDEEAASLASDEHMNYFIGVRPDLAYRIIVEEDPVAGVGAVGLRLRDEPLGAASSFSSSTSSRSQLNDVKANRQVALITAQLLTMPVEELHGAEARALREARDIEDVLYG